MATLAPQLTDINSKSRGTHSDSKSCLDGIDVIDFTQVILGWCWLSIVSLFFLLEIAKGAICDAQSRLQLSAYTEPWKCCGFTKVCELA